MRILAAQSLALRRPGNTTSAEGSVQSHDPEADAGRPATLAIRWVLLACLALSALTLLFPSTPTYDPWAWLLWGREILHLDLVTDGGPSWKPLPVMFNVPFSIFGVEAAPYLWLWIARAGALLALAMSFRLARRLVGRGAAGRGGRRVRRGVPADHLPVRARLGAGQLRGDAGRAVPVGASSATWTAAATTRSTWASAARCCGPRRGRSWACTACGCSSTSPSCG